MVYLDASALVKLVVREAETAALEAWVARWPDRASSRLARVEVTRAARRASASAASRESEEVLRQAELVLSRVALIRIDDEILERAGQLEPLRIRSLDAIHLATALSLPELAGLLTYDRHMSEAAGLAGLSVFTPGV